MRDPVERKSGRCSFFTFAVTASEDVIPLDIAVDQSHEAVVRVGRTNAAARAWSQVTQRPYR